MGIDGAEDGPVRVTANELRWNHGWDARDARVHSHFVDEVLPQRRLTEQLAAVKCASSSVGSHAALAMWKAQAVLWPEFPPTLVSPHGVQRAAFQNAAALPSI